MQVFLVSLFFKFFLSFGLINVKKNMCSCAHNFLFINLHGRRGKKTCTFAVDSRTVALNWVWFRVR